MKRYISILVAVLAMFSVLPVSAQQTQDALYIYRNDGGFNGFFFADIDRIEYSKIDTLGVEQADYVVQEVYALDSVFRIPISAIDSVTFITPETIYKKDVAHTTESDLWNYVIGSDSVKMLLLASNTPASLIPKVGDKIVTTKSRNYLPGGFYGLVKSVSSGSAGITVNCEVPALTELFDQFVCKASGSCESANDARALTRGESAADVTIPIPGVNLDVDLTNLENFPLAISKQWSLKGKGRLKAGINHSLRIRMFAAVRLLLGFNYDCVTRLETTSYLDLTASGEVGGQFDIPLFDGKTGTKYWIPDTPFCIEWEGGFSTAVSGKIEFEYHRKYVTSVYSMAQYNNSFYDEERAQTQDSFHTVANETKTSLTGEATVTAGPYFGLYATLVDKKIAKTGFRFDVGVKAAVKADLKFTDFLLSAFPHTLPAYMMLTPTPLYDHLNRDGSITFGPFFKCDFEAEFADTDKFKFSKTLFDEGKFQELTGIEMGLKFEGGLVPEFKNIKLTFDENMVPTASVDIRRPTMLYPPVGFAAYYTKSGKMLGDKTYWATDMYKESQMKNYSMQLPKFGGGKEVTVYPTVKLLRLYELLGSPYTSYTVPAEMEVTPETLEFEAKGGTGTFTIKDNLDRNEDKYEQKAEINFGGEDVKPWLKGSWNGSNYVVSVEKSDSSAARTATITLSISNQDKSVNLQKDVSVTQEAKEGNDPQDATVEPTLLEFPAEGGALFYTVDWGGYQYLRRVASDYLVNTGLKSARGEDYVSPARYSQDYYVTAPPNNTDKAMSDTVFCYFTNDKESPLSERYCIPVVIKQAAGPYDLQSIRKFFVGSWIGISYLNDKPHWERRVIFYDDGTFNSQDRFVNTKTGEWGAWSKLEKQTYSVESVTTGGLYYRVYINLTGYSSGQFVELYPHFMRHGGFYYEREDGTGDIWWRTRTRSDERQFDFLKEFRSQDQPIKLQVPFDETE